MENPEDDQRHNVSVALSDSVASDRLSDLAVTTADAGLDIALTSGALDGVPVFGLLIGVVKSGIAIRDFLFLKKVARFLITFESTPIDHRRNFIEELDRKGKKAEFGEQVLMLIDRMEDMDKPVIVGRIMSAAATGKVTLTKAMRTAKIVDRAFVDDLRTLLNFTPGLPENRVVADALFSVGLLTSTGLTMGTYEPSDRSGATYDLNEYGRIVIEYGLQQPRA